MEMRWGRSVWIFALNLGLSDLEPPAPKRTVQGTVEISGCGPWREQTSTAEDATVSMRGTVQR